MTKKLDQFQNIQALPVSTAILDATGRIVAVNDAWKAFGRRNGLCLADFGVGADYLAYCSPSASGSGALATQLRDLLKGRGEMITMVSPCHSKSRQRWFFLIGMPLSVDRPKGVAILHADLTGLLPLSGIDGAGKAPVAVLGAIEQSVTNSLAGQLRTMFVGRDGEEAEPIDPRTKLSKRQLEVLRLLGEGKTNAEIAKALFRSPHTIKLHVSAILRQLNLKSRTQAALLASQLLADKAD